MIKNPEYIIIPKSVFLSNSKEIRQVDKVLYGAIYWFHSMRDGMCFASNKALGEAVGISPKSIQASLLRLEKYGLIRRTENGKKRKIVPLISFNQPKPNDLDAPNGSSNPSQMEHIDAPNGSHSINNNINKNNNNNNTKVLLVGELPFSLGKTYILRLAKAYSILWKDFYGFDYKHDFGKTGRMFKSLLQRYNEVQIASLMIQHFNWYGATGEDERIYNNLAKNCFPLNWIPNSANSYEAYIRNTLKIDFDDETKVGDYVKKELKI